MDFWRKLTIDWPCMLGDWLWANIAMPFAALPRQMTVRRAIFIAVLLVAAIGLAQLVTADAALFMAGDLAFYCEIASAVLFIVVRGHIRDFAHVAKAVLKQATRRVAAWYRNSIGARRQRGARSRHWGIPGRMTRGSRTGLPDSPLIAFPRADRSTPRGAAGFDQLPQQQHRHRHQDIAGAAQQ